MNQQRERRRFLVAAMTLGGAALTASTPVLLAARAWASSESGAESHAALLHVARLMYPHASLDDAVYAEVLDQAMAMVASDAMFDTLLSDTEAELEAQSPEAFLDATPEQQLAALQAIDENLYWAPIQGAVANRLYSHPAAWSMMAYEGSAWARGGWLGNGAGDIGWLPEEGS